ncbi:MAG: ABC transporter ATP-binding protein [Desulfurococcales archaeon]|nr:ABC transporter ATP-binding protein [Desulfurococcales archaeon]
MPGVHAEVRGITKRYGRTLALDSVDLVMQRGRITTLLGPSGCGKTTMLKIIAGIEKPDKGTVVFDGRDVTFLPPEKRNIGFVFQDLALFPHMSVFDNVAFGLRVRGYSKSEIRRRVRDILELVGLDPEVYGDRRVTQLSGGQQQRVAIARALVFEPSMLLLDEPFAHLDYKVKMRLLSELRRIQRETGATIVYVTHDQEEAMLVSHTIAIMRAGRVVQVGPPEEVYERPSSTFVASFFGEANIIPLEGGRRHVIVRPEYVRLGPPTNGGLKGVVVDVVFQGAFYRVEVQAPQASIVAIVPKNGVHPRPGDRVSIAWDEDKALVVEE